MAAAMLARFFCCVWSRKDFQDDLTDEEEHDLPLRVLNSCRNEAAANDDEGELRECLIPKEAAMEAAADASTEASESAVFPPPSTFDEGYEVVGDQPIGEGSFGLVWSCRRRRDESTWAVKRIAKSRLQPRDMRNLFGDEGLEGEIRMHLRLRHANIVEMHQTFDEDDTISLVMEFCQSGDLFDLITSHAAKHDKALSEQAAARILRHLLSALEFLHGHRIVHRDVKCENVLLLEKGIAAEQGTYKLCDFGFATEQKKGPNGMVFPLRTRLGSPDMVAPEIVKGESYSSPVDIWGAGVLIFMALSAVPPFWASTDLGTLQRVRAGDYNFKHARWQDVSEKAKDVVRQLLAFEPGKRVTATKGLELPWVTGDSTA